MKTRNTRSKIAFDKWMQKTGEVFKNVRSKKAYQAIQEKSEANHKPRNVRSKKAFAKLLAKKGG